MLRTRHLWICAGASAETHAKNRQELYEVSKALEQAAKKQQSTAAGKQGKKRASSDQKALPKATGPSDMGASRSKLHSESGGSRKKRQIDATASANKQAFGLVESPGEPVLPEMARLGLISQLHLKHGQRYCILVCGIQFKVHNM